MSQASSERLKSYEVARYFFNALNIGLISSCTKTRCLMLLRNCLQRPNAVAMLCFRP